MKYDPKRLREIFEMRAHRRTLRGDKVMSVGVFVDVVLQILKIEEEDPIEKKVRESLAEVFPTALEVSKLRAIALPSQAHIKAIRALILSVAKDQNYAWYYDELEPEMRALLLAGGFTVTTKDDRGSPMTRIDWF